MYAIRSYYGRRRGIQANDLAWTGREMYDAVFGVDRHVPQQPRLLDARGRPGDRLDHHLGRLQLGDDRNNFV